MSLSLTRINATEITSPDLVLKEGSVAPFYGVLVAEPTYRKYQESEQEMLLYKAELSQFAGCIQPSITTPLIAFVTGFLAALAYQKSR